MEHEQNTVSRQDPMKGRLLKKKMHAVKSMGRRFEREKENMTELPDVFALAACDDDRLMKLWQGLGYYSRARSLQKAAQRSV